MGIIGLQRRLREAGRIRLGEVRQGRNGQYPAALLTFRLTSPDRALIEQAAALWGGQVTAWASPAGRQWQVTTEVDTLDVVVPTADMAMSQFYELWSGGGCQRRCDGRAEFINDTPCLCDPDARECSPTTRLNVLLPELQGLAMWRVESHGYNAAVELAGVVAVLASAADEGTFLPARLRVEQRSVKRPGKDGKPETHQFVVPTLDVGLSLLSLGGAGGAPALPTGGGGAAQPHVDAPAELEAPPPERPRQRVTGKPARSVADQVADLAGRAPREPKVPLPDTGVEPATHDQAEAGVLPDGRPAEPEPPAESPGTDDAGGMAPPASLTDPETMRRRVMAEARKTWPDLSTDDREDMRHALGVIATYTPRAAAGEAPVASVSHMTMDERVRLVALMNDVRGGQLVLERGDPTPDGCRTFRSWPKGRPGHVATLVRNSVDDWDVSVTSEQEGPS